MLDIGLFELLLFFVPILVMAFFAYWVIRLAVSHGIQDAQRARSSATARARLRETIRRQ